MYQVRGEVPEGEYTIPIGKSKVQRAGKDLTIVTYCKGLELSMKAADELAKQGIEAEVVDLRTLRPLDMEPVLESFKKTNRAIVVEEGWKSYGVGSEIVSRIYEEAFDYVDAPSSAWRKKKFRFPITARSNKPRSRKCRHHRRGKGGLEIMAETISMPKLGFDMAEGLLVRWVKQVGENINKGDVLAEIETDKATVEVESSASGVVLQLIVNQGTMVPVNAPIAVVGASR
jgi:acetyl/propionyl-CoA carboxylase alpha subunit